MNAPLLQFTNKDLRNFGLIMAGGLALIFGLFFPWVLDKATPTWPWIAAGVFTLTGLILPVALKPAYIVWMKIGHVLGYVNTRILLAILFYLVILPVGIMVRLTGHDPMSRKLDASLKTYRIESESHDAEKLENPY